MTYDKTTKTDLFDHQERETASLDSRVPDEEAALAARPQKQSAPSFWSDVVVDFSRS